MGRGPICSEKNPRFKVLPGIKGKRDESDPTNPRTKQEKRGTIGRLKIKKAPLPPALRRVLKAKAQKARETIETHETAIIKLTKMCRANIEQAAGYRQKIAYRRKKIAQWQRFGERIQRLDDTGKFNVSPLRLALYKSPKSNWLNPFIRVSRGEELTILKEVGQFYLVRLNDGRTAYMRKVNQHGDFIIDEPVEINSKPGIRNENRQISGGGAGRG